jgi:hypothetical protein
MTFMREVRGRWGDGEMGRWGDGEMGRWEKIINSILHTLSKLLNSTFGRSIW